MDPDATLREALALAHKVQDCNGSIVAPDPEDVDCLAELILALDKWIVEGGFFPHRWDAGMWAE